MQARQYGTFNYQQLPATLLDCLILHNTIYLTLLDMTTFPLLMSLTVITFTRNLLQYYHRHL